MPEIVSVLIKQFLRGGAADGGQKIHFTFRLDDGREITFLAPYTDIDELRDRFDQIAGLAYKERVTREPGHGTKGGIGEAKIKRVKQFEIGVDNKRRAVVLIGRHHDNTTTSLPIPDGDIDSIVEGLIDAKAKIQSGDRPKRH